MTTLEKQLEASLVMNDRGTALAVVPQRGGLTLADAPLRFTAEQERMIRDQYASGASPEEFAVLMEIAKERRLNPLLRQIHFVKRWDNQKSRYVWAAQISIDGMRAVAQRTGRYNGQDEPEFGPLNGKGFPEWSKVRVYRKDWDRPAVGLVYWREYVQTTQAGQPTKFWLDMPMNQLAKCAEAQALRKAFPEDCGGLYTDTEMEQATNDQPRPMVTARVESIRELPPDPPSEPQRRPITAHGNDDDPGEPTTPPDPEIFERLLESLIAIENSIPMVNDYGGALTLRALLGTKAKQSPLARDIQRAREANELTATSYAHLGKAWQRCDRQVTKLENQLKPDPVLDAFRDEDPEDFPR